MGALPFSSDPGASALVYGKLDEEIFRQNLPDNVIEFGPLGRISFSYHPPGAELGETARYVYGRVSNGNGLFDIYQFGMLGDIETTVEDVHCDEI